MVRFGRAAVDRIAIAILLGFVILAATLQWAGRYQISGAMAPGGVYVMDRWTSTIAFCAVGEGCRPVYPQGPHQ